jgi:hypothetical protein
LWRGGRRGLGRRLVQCEQNTEHYDEGTDSNHDIPHDPASQGSTRDNQAGA